MQGSEKQIKWAEEIKANLVKTYNGLIPMMPDADRPQAEYLACHDTPKGADEFKFSDLFGG